MTIMFPELRFSTPENQYTWIVDEEGNVTLDGLTEAEIALDALGEPSHAMEEWREYKDAPFRLMKDEGVFTDADYVAVAVEIMQGQLPLIKKILPMWVESIRDDLTAFQRYAAALRLSPRPMALPSFARSESMVYWIADYDDEFGPSDPRRYLLLALQILVEATQYAEEGDPQGGNRIHYMLNHLGRAHAHLNMSRATPEETLNERAKQIRAFRIRALKMLKQML